MSESQPGILAELPPLARHVVFQQRPGTNPRDAFRELEVSENIVIGLGASLVAGLGATLEGLHPFPVHVGPGFTVSSTRQPYGVGCAERIAASSCWRADH